MTGRAVSPPRRGGAAVLRLLREGRAGGAGDGDCVLQVVTVCNSIINNYACKCIIARPGGAGNYRSAAAVAGGAGGAGDGDGAAVLVTVCKYVTVLYSM
jgi:hypothetical protein